MGTNKTIGITIDPRMDLNKLRQDANITGRIIEDLNRKISSASSPQVAAQDLFGSFVTRARGYTTSAPEMMRSIYDQQKTLFEQRHLSRQSAVSGIEQRYKEGKLPKEVYQELVSGYKGKEQQDKLILSALREIINVGKTTSKDEIIENRKAVEDYVRKSGTSNRYIRSGDDPYDIYKQTLQQRMLSDLSHDEKRQRGGGSLQNIEGRITSIGGNLVEGNVVGAAGGLARPALTALAAMGTAGLITGAIGIAALITAKVVSDTNTRTPSRLREFAVATQTGTKDIYNTQQDIYNSGVYKNMGLTAEEFLQGSTGFYRSTGGRNLTPDQLAGFTGLTRSRDVSPELLNQTLGLSRYDSSGGSSITAIKSLENTLRSQYKDDEEYKRKLIQLPEMMSAYNNIASSVLATTGRVDQARISNFVGNVSQQFGVEGVNLQRYSSGISRMMGKTGNSFVNAMQMKVIRDLYPGLSNADLYQKTLEIQQDPTSNPEYMKAMNIQMKKVGGGKFSPEYRSWAAMGDFGAAEAKSMFGKDFDPTRVSGAVTSDEATVLSDYVKAASDFYAKSETWQKEIKDFFINFGSNLGEELQNGIEKGTKKAWQGTPFTVDPEPKLKN